MRFKNIICITVQISFRVGNLTNRKSFSRTPERVLS